MNTLEGSAYPSLSGNSYTLKHEIDIKFKRGQIGGAREDLFHKAQQLTRRHLQWVVVHDYLRRLCGDFVVDDILKNGRKLYLPDADDGGAYIPIEFAAAVFRYDHTQVPRDRFHLRSLHFDSQ